MAEERIERLILRGLSTNDHYGRKVFPHLRPQYFENPSDQIVYKTIDHFFEKYNTPPTKDALSVALASDKSIPENLYPTIKEIVAGLDPIEGVNEEWLVDQTEAFCKDRAVYNAILQSIEIMEGKDKKYTKDSLPQILQDALAVGFDNDVGHDYFGDIGERYDFIHSDEARIPFKLKLLNEVTKGGVPRKTLNIIMAGTNVGKSMFMCDWAAFLLMQGYNVLYVTAEMAEFRIAERIDANLLNVTIDELNEFGKAIFEGRMAKLNEKTKGRLIIKEYATATAHTGHLSALLNELKIKQNFKPDIIFVDYLNIMCSQRFKVGTDSYTYVKAIAEELRGFAVVHDVPVISATQVNRGGYSNTDMDLDDTSESWGLPSTADFFIALISSEELLKLNQQMVKQLKSRYGNPNKKKRFVVGVDQEKQRYYDVEDKAQLVGQSAVMIAEKEKSAESITNDFFKPAQPKAGWKDSKDNNKFSGLKV
jgi:replicative DNA helicase